MIILDTDHFSVVADSRHKSHAALLARLESTDEPLMLSVVSVEEMFRGWLAQVR